MTKDKPTCKEKNLSFKENIMDLNYKPEEKMSLK